MQNKLVIILILFILTFMAGCEKKDNQFPTKGIPPAKDLPIIGYSEFKSGNALNKIWELEHGWLVFHNHGLTAGLTFVPKAQETEKLLFTD